MPTSTPHIEAAPGDFASTVLMPGDPLRAKHIAETFLENVRQINGVRNMLGFTGSYRGIPVSVMGSGMGIPSISIYARELWTVYEVENVIRVGSCGTCHHDVQIRDVIIGTGACTDSRVNRSRFNGHDFAAIADFELTRRAVNAAQQLNIPVRTGNLFSADLFYNPDPGMFDVIEQMGVLGIEMEAAGLYGCAAECGKQALAICTVSDHIRSGEATTSEERQTSFNDMIQITLESLC
ncbi:MAG: purine-nucleoside phosphorylase [Verrucomicrobiaceae bacterium]|nr:purine-nucleoside phosphorylase [Verrucomicrobiaceae bacterium]